MKHDSYVDYVEASVSVSKGGDVVIKPDRNDCDTCTQAGCCLDSHYTCQFFEGFDGMIACSLSRDFNSLMAKSRLAVAEDGVMIVWWSDKINMSFAVLLNIDEFVASSVSPTPDGWYLPQGTFHATNLATGCDENILNTLSDQILKLAWGAAKYEMLPLLLRIVAAMDPRYCNSL